MFMFRAEWPASFLLDKTPLDIVQKGAIRAFMPYLRAKDESGCSTLRLALGI